MDILKNFHALCGEYSMNQLKVSDGEASAMLFHRGKKIGSVMRIANSQGENFVSYMPEAERQTLREWADHAGPYGFDNEDAFLQYLLDHAIELIKWRTQVRQGYLVSVSLATDEHELPKLDTVNVSRTKPKNFDDAWVKEYAKRNQGRIIINKLL